MQSHARVVVIGGGNMGVSVLYHLAKAGWTDCLLIEKGELTSGATWHAAGLVSRMIAGFTLGSMHDYAVDLYKRIEDETGQSVSWHGCGSLRVATSDDHDDWLRHVYDGVLARRQDAFLLSVEEFSGLNPLYDTKTAGVTSALYTPDDGHVDPSGACFAMAKGARALGAKIQRHTRVTDVRQRPGGEWEVHTEQGLVRCEHVVNAGGYHARQIGAFSGLDLPITTLLHHYVITDDVPEFSAMTHEIPVTRDDYLCGYLRREQQSVLIGLYDKQAPQAVWLDGCPWESANHLFEPNLEGITPWLERAMKRCPTLAERGIKRIVNGGITYTPDGAMLLGPAPGLENYWLACGATVGIAWGPGAGLSLAQWIMHGAADWSMRAFDPRRFGVWADADYARVRAIEDYTLRQAIPYPQHQRTNARNVKRSGAHEHTTERGALFEEAGGWERPRLFHPDEPMSFRRTSTFDVIQKEARSVRERVGLGDFSAFAKFDVRGADAHRFLNRVCANHVPSEPGRTCLTALLNARGTYEGEATIACLDENRFWFVTGAPSERRVWDWLSVHQRGEERVELVNRTDDVGILTLAGPHARDVLALLTSADLSNASFAWLRAKEIDVAGVPVIALRLSFTGDLAYELHAPNGRLGELWDVLWEAGQAYGIAPFGAKALDALRIEKAYRGGHELSGDAAPTQVGLMRLVAMDKSFVGRDALETRIAEGERVTLAYLKIDSDDADVLGGEAVFADGRAIGSVTSGAFGPAVNKSLAFAYIEHRFNRVDSEVWVSLLGSMRRAVVLDGPALDPANERLKAV